MSGFGGVATSKLAYLRRCRISRMRAGQEIQFSSSAACRILLNVIPHVPLPLLFSGREELLVLGGMLVA